MTDEPRSPLPVADAQLANLLTRFVAAADDASQAEARAQIAAEIERAVPGTMQQIANSLDARKVRLGRVTLQ